MIDWVKRLIKKNKFFYYVVCVAYRIYGMLTAVLYFVMRVFPVKRNKIVCCNMKGKRYGDNPKYIVDEIIRQKLDYEIVWLMKDEYDADLPKGVRRGKYNILSCAYELATAKFWIDSNTKQLGTLKRKNQYYIQTWHGSYGLKKMYGAIPDKITFFDRCIVQYNSKIMDLILSNSKFSTKIYREAFWYDGKMLECGSPKNDIFFEDSMRYVEKVKDFFGLKDEKLVLYAPTYRDDYRTEDMYMDFERLRINLRQRFGGEWVVLIRLHPNNMADAAKFITYTERVINATGYNVMQELLVASDLLISDYSSCMFDFVTKKAPCFMFATDVQRYRDERDFYFNLRELPFPLAENEEELERNILEFDERKYIKDLEQLFTKVGLCDDGNASKRVAEWILERT